VQARLGLGDTGVLDAELPLPLPATLFGRARWRPGLGAVAVCLVLMAWLETRAARRDRGI
jgi:hypothetical protein